MFVMTHFLLSFIDPSDTPYVNRRETTTTTTSAVRAIVRITIIAHHGEVNLAPASAQWWQVKPRRRLDGEKGDDNNK